MEYSPSTADPTLSFLDSSYATDALSGLATGMDDAFAQLGSALNDLAQVAQGETVDSAVSQLGSIRSTLTQSGYNFAVVGASLKQQQSANDLWHRNAPTDNDLARADQELTAARQQLASASDDDAPAASSRVNSALANLRDLRDKRESADKAHADDSQKARDKLNEVKAGDGEKSKDKKGKGKRQGDDDHALPGKSGPKSTGGTGTSNAKMPGAPLPSSTASPAGADGDTDAAIATLLAQQGQPQQQQPVQLPPQQPQQAQPQAAPAAAGGGQPAMQSAGAQNRKADGVIDTDDLDRELGLGGAGLGAAAVPVAAPTALRPDFTAPAPSQPSTSGTSSPGMHTSSDVSGRSEPARSAYTPTTTTSAASAATAAGGANASALNTRGAPGGMPMSATPMASPMTGGAPGSSRAGGGKERKIMAHDNPLLHGEDAMAEAVRGGTIAQNREND